MCEKPANRRDRVRDNNHRHLTAAGPAQMAGGGTPEEFRKTVRSELALYAKIIQDANIRRTP